MLPAIVILFSAIIPFITILPLRLASDNQHSFNFPSIPAAAHVFPSVFTLDYKILVTPKPDKTFLLSSPTPSTLASENLDILAIERAQRLFIVYKGVVLSQADLFVAYVACVFGIFFLSGCLTFGYIARRRRQILRQLPNPATTVCHSHSVSIPTVAPRLRSSPILEYHNTMEGQISTHATDDIVLGGTRHGLGFHFLSSPAVGGGSNVIPLEEIQANRENLESEFGRNLCVNVSPPSPNIFTLSSGPAFLPTSQDISIAGPASQSQEGLVTKEDGIQIAVIAPVDPTNSGTIELVEQTCNKNSAELKPEKKLPWFMIPPPAPRINSRYRLRQPQPIPVPNYLAISPDSHSESEVEKKPYAGSSLTQRMQRTSVDKQSTHDAKCQCLGQHLRSCRAVANLDNVSVSPVQSNKPAPKIVNRRILNNPRSRGPYSRKK